MNERLTQVELRQICLACDRIVPRGCGCLPECRCGYDGYVPVWFERSPVPRKWWQFWKLTLIDGMTWGSWVRSERKYQEPDPPPPPPPDYHSHG